jgi:tol-pal system protein YbgF
MRMGALLVACVLALAGPAFAQDGRTLADVKAELTVLNGQIQQLRDELVRTGAAGGLPAEAASGLERLDQLEAELRFLTDRVEVLTNDVIRITEDASNRVGDIEFRLTELEGGDASVKPPVVELGGGVTRPRPRPVAPAAAEAGGGSLAVAEQSDFDAAVAAAGAGDNQKAADLFGAFVQTYPDGPLTADAQFRRGQAFEALGQWKAAGRSYLDVFHADPQGAMAPKALYRLAISLSQDRNQPMACLTLAQIDSRYPGSELAGEVAAQRQALACQ